MSSTISCNLSEVPARIVEVLFSHEERSFTVIEPGVKPERYEENERL
jgi:hypothetical protein